MFAFFRRRRRRQLAAQPFPDEWKTYLERNIPFYRTLTESELSVYLTHVKVFAWEKTFTGVQGMEITDEVRVVISATAARLVLNLDLERYDDLREIVVYPYDYRHPQGDARVLGEATAGGTVVLSWPSVMAGLSNPCDGLHTAIHEFAHVLDAENRGFDGVPTLRANEDYRPWAVVLGTHFEELKKGGKSGAKSLRPYGKTNAAEFFAVATEAYFEKPRQMKKHTPELYEQLQKLYGGDPASRHLDVVAAAKRPVSD
jgi:Mlc titration factor MtfA (ptsG expression regulator)